MPNPVTLRTTSLYMSDPSTNTDKEYHVHLRQGDGGYTVDFAYGRRSGSLATGTKTAQPVQLLRAETIERRLIAEKVGKGYVEDTSGQRDIGTDTGEASGYAPQLLNAIDRVELESMIATPLIGFQQKADGERRLLLIDQGLVRGINRKGEFVGIPAAWTALGQSLQRKVVIDGEHVADVLYAFDLLVDGVDITQATFADRFSALERLVEALGRPDFLRLLPVARGSEEKARLVADLEARKAEGVVARLLCAQYTAGRPNSGGTALKYKFWESSTAIVGTLNPTRRSVGLLMLDDDRREVAVGNVTIPPNAEVPAVGALVEVRYLYRAGAQGALFQPTYLGERKDLTREAATLRQIQRVKQPPADDTEALAA